MREKVAACALVVPFALGWLAAPSHPGDPVFRFQDNDIVESSGLVVEGGLFLTTNDSGDSGRVFAVDPDSGETVGVTRWSEDPTDVEALAPAGDRSVWVGDIGDNEAQRDSIEVTRVPVGAAEVTVDEPTYDLVYPEGAVNAESLLAQPRTGRLYVATKDVFGGALYAAPTRLDPDRANRLRRVGAVLPIATDGAFFPDGRHLILRDYSQAVVYTFPDLERVGSFRLPDQEQGEGIDRGPRRRGLHQLGRPARPRAAGGPARRRATRPDAGGHPAARRHVGAPGVPRARHDLAGGRGAARVRVGRASGVAVVPHRAARAGRGRRARPRAAPALTGARRTPLGRRRTGRSRVISGRGRRR